MSTTFGFKKIIDNKEKEVEIAFRANSSVVWLNNFEVLEDIIPEETLVIALDNTNQGINTFGDLKKAINKEVGQRERLSEETIEDIKNCKLWSLDNEQYHLKS
jgi:hypothetical protein